MDISASDLFKNNSTTNITNRTHDMPLITFARVAKVIDVQTVIVRAIIQTSLSIEVYTVSLLNLSSALLELNVHPEVGDTVLVFFLQRHNPLMFATDDFIEDPDATGYNRYSGVGILMSTVKRLAQTLVNFYRDGDKSVADIHSRTDWRMAFHGLMGLIFRRADPEGDDKKFISLLFGEGRPLLQQFLSAATHEHGFWKDSEDEWVELDAPVLERYSKYAPITRDIQGKQVTNVGLGLDKFEGKPVETDAPITQTIHGKSPVVKNIRSPQTITIGIGNDESNSSDEQRNAPINMELGEKADITIESKSGFVSKFKKKLDLLFEDTIQFISKRAITLKSNSTELIEIGNQIATLKGILDEYNDILQAFGTMGSPYRHSTDPPTILKLQALKTKHGQVFK